MKVLIVVLALLICFVGFYESDSKKILGSWKSETDGLSLFYTPDTVTAISTVKGNTYQHSGSWIMEDGILIENIDGEEFYSKYRFEDDSLILRFSMSNKDIYLRRANN